MDSLDQKIVEYFPGKAASDKKTIIAIRPSTMDQIMYSGPGYVKEHWFQEDGYRLLACGKKEP